MNVAEQALAGSQLRFDVSADVNETAAIVFDAKVRTGGGKSGVLLIGGGSPKNFVLQTEPQIQEVLGISEKGHDYYLQMTDARPDTGRPLGRDARRGRELGQDRSGAAPRHGGVLSATIRSRSRFSPPTRSRGIRPGRSSGSMTGATR